MIYKKVETVELLDFEKDFFSELVVEENNGLFRTYFQGVKYIGINLYGSHDDLNKSLKKLCMIISGKEVTIKKEFFKDEFKNTFDIVNIKIPQLVHTKEITVEDLIDKPKKYSGIPAECSLVDKNKEPQDSVCYPEKDNVVIVIDTAQYKSSYAKELPFKAKVINKDETIFIVESLKTGKIYELYSHQILEVLEINKIKKLFELM